MEQNPIYNNKVGTLAKLFLGSTVFRLFMAAAAMLVFCVVKRDDLQEAIALLRKGDFGIPLQFENVRD